MKTYSVHARPWTDGWELYIDNVGVTQSHTLRDADEMARDYIALDLDVPGDSFDVDVIPEDHRVAEIWRMTVLPEAVRSGLIEFAITILRQRAAWDLDEEGGPDQKSA